MEIFSSIILGLTKIVIGFIVTSFVVAFFHTRTGRERIAENVMSSDEYKEYTVDRCSCHIIDRLTITAEKVNDFGDLKIEFSRPVIDALFWVPKSELVLTADNRRVFIIPTTASEYIIKIKSAGKYPARFSIEREWEGLELAKFLLSKVKLRL